MADKDIFICESDNTLYGIPQNINTIPKFLKTYCQKYNLRRCLGTREFLRNGQRGQYEWYSYGQVYYQAVLLAKGLQLYEFKRGDKIGVISSNRAELLILNFACSIAGIIMVPLYVEQSEDEYIQIINNIQFSGCFISFDYLSKIERFRDKLNNIIVFDDRYDDRAQVQTYKEFNSQWKIELPQFTCFQMHSQYYFDKIDKQQGIYDPSINQQTYPDDNDINKKVIRFKMHENGYYPYSLEEEDMKILINTQSVSQHQHFELITLTFHQIIQRGYLALFDRDYNAFMVDNSAETIETCFSLQNKAQQQDIYMMITTPGTESQQKVLKINHTNILWSTIMQIYAGFQKDLNLISSVGKNIESKQEFFMSNISPAHISTMLLQLVTTAIGGAIGFFTLQTDFFDDIRTLRPTFMHMSRLAIRHLKDLIHETVSKFNVFKQKSYKKALSMRQKYLEEVNLEYQEQLLAVWNEYMNDNQNGKGQQSDAAKNQKSHVLGQKKGIYISQSLPWTPNNIFDVFRNALGKRCRLITSFQPICYHDVQFISSHFDVLVQNSWQMSESSGHGLIRGQYDCQNQYYGVFPDKNTVLGLNKITELKCGDWAVKSVTLEGKTIHMPVIYGQVVISGPSVAQEEIFDSQAINTLKHQEQYKNGFFYSGDIGEYNAITHQIKILGRISEAIMMNNDHRIFVSDIERLFETMPLVNHAYLYHKAQPDEKIAFIGILQLKIPNQKQNIQKRNQTQVTTQNVFQNTNYIEQILQNAQQCLEKSGYAQKIKLNGILIDTNEWTIQEGHLTPLFEVKRQKMLTIFETFCNSFLEELTSKEQTLALMQKYSALISDRKKEGTGMKQQ